MNRAKLKLWAKNKIKGHIGELFIALLITSIVTNITIGGHTEFDGSKINVSAGVPVGLLLYFVEVGLAYYMVNFINDRKYELKDLFHFFNDFARIFLTRILESVFVFLWTLLLIIPGIIKSIAYSLVPLILADDKYKDLGYMEILKKSEEMMNGHKKDYFVLLLSFIGWHLLAIFTLGLLEIWIMPYQATAKYKFLNDIKNEYK